MDMDRKEAGFVGLGFMGAPMAANLLKAGWAVTAWNRSPAALDAFEALGGARVAGVGRTPRRTGDRLHAPGSLLH